MLLKYILPTVVSFSLLGCHSANKVIIGSSNKPTELILEGGVKLTINDLNVLPIEIKYQNNRYLILKKGESIVVKNLSFDGVKPPQGNF